MRDEKKKSNRNLKIAAAAVGGALVVGLIVGMSLAIKIGADQVHIKK